MKVRWMTGERLTHPEGRASEGAVHRSSFSAPSTPPPYSVNSCRPRRRRDAWPWPLMRRVHDGEGSLQRRPPIFSEHASIERSTRWAWLSTGALTSAAVAVVFSSFLEVDLCFEVLGPVSESWKCPARRYPGVKRGFRSASCPETERDASFLFILNVRRRPRIYAP